MKSEPTTDPDEVLRERIELRARMIKICTEIDSATHAIAPFVAKISNLRAEYETLGTRLKQLTDAV